MRLRINHKQPADIMNITKPHESNFIEQPLRRRIRTSWIVPLLLLWMMPAGLGLMMVGQVTAQSFTTLYSFQANGDGEKPSAGLVLSGSTLYGTAVGGGSAAGNGGDFGEVFAVNTDGTGFTNWLEEGQLFPNLSGLILSGNTLYGMGSELNLRCCIGTKVFAFNTDGTGFTNLSVAQWGGFTPTAGLILSGNTLYGTAYGGGIDGIDTVFAVNTDFTGFTNLYTFTTPVPDNDSKSPAYDSYTNIDGFQPAAGLILSGNTLYGTAAGGGSGASGTVFAVNTDGMGFTTLHSFTATTSCCPPNWLYLNSDGANPIAGLILSGNTLYGTASQGGTSGGGTVFAVNTVGMGFTVLHSFTTNAYGTHSDGSYPAAGLILSGKTLYGTTEYGGSWNNGTVFAVNTDGTGFTVLHSFSATVWNPNTDCYTNSDGAYPVAGLLLSGNTLYGTAAYGGTNGNGTVFSIFIQPQLTIIPSGPYMILAWPTNYSGFTLQSTTNFGSAAVWTTNSSPPVVIGGENVVINTTTTGKQTFFRLSQ